MSISLKNSGGVLSRRSPRTIDSTPIDEPHSGQKRPVFGIGMYAPAATKAELLQPVLRKQSTFKSPLLSMRKYPQHVLKRVIRDERGASLKNSGRTYGLARHCYMDHAAAQENLNKQKEPKTETNPIIGQPSTGPTNHAQTDRTNRMPAQTDNKIWIQPHMEN